MEIPPVGDTEVPPRLVVWVVPVVDVALDGTTAAVKFADVEVLAVVVADEELVVVGADEVAIVEELVVVVAEELTVVDLAAVVLTGANGVGIGVTAVVVTIADGVGIGVAAVVVTIADGVGIGVAAVVVTICGACVVGASTSGGAVGCTTVGASTVAVACGTVVGAATVVVGTNVSVTGAARAGDIPALSAVSETAAPAASPTATPRARQIPRGTSIVAQLLSSQRSRHKQAWCRSTWNRFAAAHSRYFPATRAARSK